MGLTRGMEISKQLGTIPVGFIEERCEKDKFLNDVSLVRLAHGRIYRMVHRSMPYPKHRRQYATVYAGRGKYVKLAYNITENDMEESSISLAGYSMSWGDGDTLRWSSNPKGPNIDDVLRNIHDCCFDTFIVQVLSAIENVDECWEYKAME